MLKNQIYKIQMKVLNIFTGVSKFETINVPIATGQSCQMTRQVLLHELQHVAKDRERRRARESCR